jgi:hypothetical protein
MWYKVSDEGNRVKIRLMDKNYLKSSSVVGRRPTTALRSKKTGRKKIAFACQS